MAERRFLQQGKAAIQITTESESPGTTAVGPDMVQSIQAIARLLARALAELDEDTPDKVQISFGLGVSAEGSIVITHGTTGRNLDVTLSWGSGEDQLTKLAPAPPDTDLPQ